MWDQDVVVNFYLLQLKTLSYCFQVSITTFDTLMSTNFTIFIIDQVKLTCFLNYVAILKY